MPRSDLFLRSYGSSGPMVVVLHGGPAAAGHAEPLARGLADAFRTLEPWQRGSGREPLSVARHIEDLAELIDTRCDSQRPALVGESWGAMLALAYAAAHPDTTGPIVIIGCGTFDVPSRERLQSTIDGRIDKALRRRIERLDVEISDPEERLRAKYSLTKPLYLFDPIDEEQVEFTLDVQAHLETWQDMIRLQAEGVYPSAFSSITSPILMLHGAYDPHPGLLIRKSLEPFLSSLEYREWELCGHSPWLERALRDEFFAELRSWLLENICEEAESSGEPDDR